MQLVWLTSMWLANIVSQDLPPSSKTSSPPQDDNLLRRHRLSVFFAERERVARLVQGEWFYRSNFISKRHYVMYIARHNDKRNCKMPSTRPSVEFTSPGIRAAAVCSACFSAPSLSAVKVFTQCSASHESWIISGAFIIQTQRAASGGEDGPKQQTVLAAVTKRFYTPMRLRKGNRTNKFKYFAVSHCWWWYGEMKTCIM